MKRIELFRWAAVLALAIAVVPTTASAQEADTLSISGTYHMDEMWGIAVGDDLAEVFAGGNEHLWLLTLHGISYSYDYYFYETDDEYGYSYEEAFITRVHATSFDFQFFGPDADVLNAVVSQQLTRGGLADDAFLTLTNGDWYESIDPWAPNLYTLLDLQLSPPDYFAGVSFSVSFPYLWNEQSPTNANGYPLLEPRSVTSDTSFIRDFRSANVGELLSYEDIVNIGSSEPPPAPPSLSIEDDSVLEGKRGTTPLKLTVTLSKSSPTQVTVEYATSNGTALAKSDYNATSGTLTIPAGQTQGTISVGVKGDRKREPNETFSVTLSNPVGATISDGTATATILNDD